MLGAPVTWIGEAPAAGDIASGSKRRRGRPARGGRAAGGRCLQVARRRQRWPLPQRIATARAAMSRRRGARTGRGARTRRLPPAVTWPLLPTVMSSPGWLRPRLRRPRRKSTTSGPGRARRPKHRASQKAAPARGAEGRGRAGSPARRAVIADLRGERGRRDRSVRRAGRRSSLVRPRLCAGAWEPRPPRSPDRGRERRPGAVTRWASATTCRPS